MMLSKITSLVISRDAIVSQLCAIIVPPILIVVILLQFLGKPIALKLLKLDSFRGGRIKPRAYGIIRSCIIGIFCIFLIIYFSLNSTWDMVACVILFLVGYSWIVYGHYKFRLQYTDDYLRYCTRKVTQIIHFSDITGMTWEGCRGSIVYYLMIRLGSGKLIHLSSGDFVGLKELLNKYNIWRDAHPTDSA